MFHNLLVWLTLYKSCYNQQLNADYNCFFCFENELNYHVLLYQYLQARRVNLYKFLEIKCPTIFFFIP